MAQCCTCWLDVTLLLLLLVLLLSEGTLIARASASARSHDKTNSSASLRTARCLHHTTTGTAPPRAPRIHQTIDCGIFGVAILIHSGTLRHVSLPSSSWSSLLSSEILWSLAGRQCPQTRLRKPYLWPRSLECCLGPRSLHGKKGPLYLVGDIHIAAKNENGGKQI